MGEDLITRTEEPVVTEEPTVEDVPKEPQEPEPTGEPQEEPANPYVEELETARQKADEAMARAAELEEQIRRQDLLLSRASDSSDPAPALAAQMPGMEPEELEAAVKEELEAERMETEREALKEDVQRLKPEKAMEADLIEVQKMDPDVKDLSEPGDACFRCIASGMGAACAYHASRSIAEKTTPSAPAEIGKLSRSGVQKDSYTREEVESMTAEEIEKTLQKTEASMRTWTWKRSRLCVSGLLSPLRGPDSLKRNRIVTSCSGKTATRRMRALSGTPAIPSGS